MAKITKITRGPLAPEGTYRGVLGKCRDYKANTQFGEKEKLAWPFRLAQRKIAKGDKMVFVDIPDENLEVMKSTGLSFGSKRAEATIFLNTILPFGVADLFIEQSGDTDELEGLTAELRIEHTVEGEETYANITLAITDDDWLLAFKKSMGKTAK